MQALFPRQVNAVVVNNGKVDLSVTQSPAVGSDQPIVVVFRRDDEIWLGSVQVDRNGARAGGLSGAPT